MKYTEKASELAAREIEARRTAALEEQRRRETEITARMPEIGVLRKKLRDNYIRIIKLVATHDNRAAETAANIREESLSTSESIALMLENSTGDRNYLEPKYTCPNCQDTGYVDGIRCECLEKLLMKYTLEEMSSGSAIKLHDFGEFRTDYYPPGEIRERMIKYHTMFVNYCQDFGGTSTKRSMLFMGETGLGKTFFSSCIVKRLGEMGISAAFMSAFDMLRTLENEHFGRAEGDTMGHLLTAPLVVIDDLGAEPSQSKFYNTFFYNIINGRINRMLPTIISTNLTPDIIKARYGNRIASRMLSEFLPVLFRGTDIRQQKSAQRIYST
ncbi:MAG: ATP-binding protein [Ruminococcus sp.]|nr:ATP-binding protein [Ruminococcus sp.]